MKTATTFTAVQQSLLTATLHQDLHIINIINLHTLTINNTTLSTKKIIFMEQRMFRQRHGNYSSIEQSADTKNKISIMNKDSNIVATTEDMMSKATMIMKKTIVKLIILAIKEKLSYTSIMIDYLTNMTM